MMDGVAKLFPDRDGVFAAGISLVSCLETHICFEHLVNEYVAYILSMLAYVILNLILPFIQCI
jgi:hypothetical protein